jgi:hypothetical protein
MDNVLNPPELELISFDGEIIMTSVEEDGNED